MQSVPVEAERWASHSGDGSEGEMASGPSWASMRSTAVLRRPAGLSVMVFGLSIVFIER